MLKLEHLTYYYPGAKTPVLRDVSCSFSRGAVTVITGVNGCGKTTLMKLIAGLLRPEEGRIFLQEDAENQDENKRKETDLIGLSLSEIGQKIGYVYQDPTRQLFCETVREEIAYGLRNRKAWNEEEINHRIDRMLKLFRLEEKAEAYPGTMSQGEKQRVMLAAILAMENQYILLDEPTSGLDREGCRALGETLRELAMQGTGLILVSHERAFIDAYADEELRLQSLGAQAGHTAPSKPEKYVGTEGAEEDIAKEKKPLLKRFDARPKMLLAVAVVMVSLLKETVAVQLGLLAVLLLVLFVGGIAWKQALRQVRMMLGLTASIFLLQCIFVRSGASLLSIGHIPLVTVDGFSMALTISVRLLLLTGTGLLIATSGFRDSLAALTQMHLPYEIVFSVMAGLKFLPMLKEETTDVFHAAKMRGMNYDKMSLRKKLQLYLRLALPICAGAIRRADHMSVAMTARSFRAYPTRTALYRVHLKLSDWLCMAGILLFTAGALIFL